MVTIGFGTFSPASRIRMPRPPQNNTTFIALSLPPEASDRDLAHRAPAHARIEPPRAQEIGNPPEPHVIRKHISRQSVLREALVELFDAAADRPLGPEAGQMPRQLAAVDPVASRVWAAAFGVPHHAVRDHLLDHPNDVVDLIVLVGGADIERLVVDRLTRRFKHCKKGARDVFDVDQWTPWGAVALDEDFAGRVR